MAKIISYTSDVFEGPGHSSGECLKTCKAPMWSKKEKKTQNNLCIYSVQTESKKAYSAITLDGLRDPFLKNSPIFSFLNVDEPGNRWLESKP